MATLFTKIINGDIPGTFVAMGRYGLRMPSGASGFMSNVSSWLGPPHWNRKITDFAFGANRNPRLRA